LSYIDKIRASNGVSVRFRARWRDPSGREKAKTFDSRRQALDFLVKVDAAKAVGSYVDPSHGKLLVKEYAAEWLAGRDVRPSTEARDGSLVRSYIIPEFGQVPIGAVRAADVAAWKVRLLEGHAPATVGKALTLFKQMLATAVAHGLLPANPIATVKLPKVERDEMRFLTPAEISALTEAIDPRYKALVLVAAYGGLRIGELAGLQVADVDTLRGTIAVERQVVEVAGKLSLGPLKTRTARRRVKLPRFVVEELAAHLAKYHGDTSTGGLVFPAPNGGLLSRTMFRQRFWVPAVNRVHLSGLRPHDLRHTAVSLWIAGEANPKEVARRAGHTSVRVVFDIYGHLLPDSDDALIEKLEQMAKAATESPQPTGTVVSLERQQAPRG
jgi:integrase